MYRINNIVFLRDRFSNLTIVVLINPKKNYENGTKHLDFVIILNDDDQF